MFKIGKTLVSEEIIDTYFHCNVDACKGACLDLISPIACSVGLRFAIKG